MTIRDLKCSCCGADAGCFEQWWNRDTGWGVCRKCVDEEVSHGETEEGIRDLYGVEGVHYAAKDVLPIFESPAWKGCAPGDDGDDLPPSSIRGAI